MTEIKTADTEVDLISAGVILGGLSRAQVIKRLRLRFSVSHEQALSMLKEGKLLKKSIPNHSSNKLIKLFASLGLEVLAHPCDIQKKAYFEASNDPEPAKGRDKIETTDSILTASLTKTSDRLLYLTGFFQVVSVASLILLLFGVWLIGIVANVLLISFMVKFGFVTAILSLLPVGILIAQCVITGLFAGIIWGKYPERQGFIVPREEAEDLYQLTECVCDKLNVVHPNHIQINNEVDVNIVSPGNIKDFYTGRFALNLGLPVAGCFDVRELTGLIAFAASIMNNKALMRFQIFAISLREAIDLRVHYENTIDNKIRELVTKDKVWWMHIGADAVIKINLMLRKSLKLLGLVINQLLAATIRGLRKRALAYEVFTVGEQSYRKNTINLVKLVEARESVSQLNDNAWRLRRLFRSKARAVEQLFNNRQKTERPRKLLSFTADTQFRVSLHPLRFENFAVKKQSCGVHPNLEQFFSRGSAKKLFFDFYEISEQVSLDGYIESYIEGFGGVVRESEFYGQVPERWTVDEQVVFDLNQGMSLVEDALDDFLGFSYENRILTLDEPTNTELLKMNIQGINDWIRERLIGYREDNSSLTLLKQDALLKALSQALSSRGIKVASTNLLSVIAFNCRKNNTESSQAELEKTFQPSSSEISENLEMVSSRLDVIDRLYYQRIVHAIQLMDDQEKYQAQQLLTSLQNFEDLNFQLQKLKESVFIVANLDKIKPKTLLRKVTSLKEEHAKNCAEIILKLYKRAQDINIYDDTNEVRSLSQAIADTPGFACLKNASLPLSDCVKLASEVLDSVTFYYSYMLAQLAFKSSQAELTNHVKPLKIVIRKPTQKIVSAAS